jgi:uncharacterized protein (DUF433 family)
MAATSVEIGTLIDRDPRIRSGRTKIAGTGVTVRRIAGWYKLGFSAEDIVRKIPHLSAAQVAALAYYHANGEEIDADLAAEQEEAERLEQQYGQPAE